MVDTLRIKRRALGGAVGAPGSLAIGELAFNEQDTGLYIGRSDGSVVQVNPTSAGPTGPTGSQGTTGTPGGAGAVGPTGPTGASAAGSGASSITFAPVGNIAATDVQAAIAELDNEKVAKAGDTMTGPLVLSAAGTQSATALNFGTAGVGLWGNTTSVGTSTGGSNRLVVTTTAVNFSLPAIFPSSGTASATTVNFGTAGTGLYGTATNIFAAIGGTQTMSLGSVSANFAVPINLPASDPVSSFHATSKGYVDRKIMASDTPPATPLDNSFWFESDSGLLFYRYNDGDSSQWVMPGSGVIDAVRYGAVQTLTAVQKSQAQQNIGAYPYSTIKKNYIINGAMMVSQENGTTAGAFSASYYAIDQFLGTQANSTAVVGAQQVAVVTPAGSPNRFQAVVSTADATVGAGDIIWIETRLEGLRVADLSFGTTAAKTVTVQFGVKAPAGTYTVSLLNSAASPNRSYTAEYVISAGEANTDVVKSVTIPGDTTGTWPKDNTTGLVIRWGLMAGTTYQQAAGSWGIGNPVGSPNQVNFAANSANVFQLFDVSLTEGNVAPPFQVPDFASELALCQRYWQKSYDYATATGTVTTNGAAFLYTTGLTGTPSGGSTAYFKTSMRVAPVVNAYSPRDGAIGKMGDSNYAVNVNVIIGAPSINIFQWYGTAGGVGVLNFQMHWTANARL